MIKSLEECVDMSYADLFAEIQDLLNEIKGPDDFETWKDAAIDERVKRVKAEQSLKDFIFRIDVPGWSTIRVVGFDEFMEAVHRADQNGYLPSALQVEYDNFNYEKVD